MYVITHKNTAHFYRLVAHFWVTSLNVLRGKLWNVNFLLTGGTPDVPQADINPVFCCPVSLTPHSPPESGENAQNGPSSYLKSAGALHWNHPGEWIPVSASHLSSFRFLQLTPPGSKTAPPPPRHPFRPNQPSSAFLHQQSWPTT